MRNFATRAAMGLLLALIALTPLKPATGQEPSMPGACGELAFSTEEDFVTHGPEPADGNPYISDGDLLGDNCIVCARNLDLLMPFDVTVDLGLDAVDVINPEDYLVAFSTELDSPHGDQFTAGDLLVNAYGLIIPNVALTHQFQLCRMEDQSQPEDNYGFLFGDEPQRWQAFIPSLDNISAIDLILHKDGTPPGDVLVEVRTMDDTVLGQGVVPEASVPQLSGWVTADFPTPVPVSPGKKHRIYVYATQASPDNKYFWRGDQTSSYCPDCDTDVVSAWPDYRYAFKTHGFAPCGPGQPMVGPPREDLGLDGLHFVGPEQSINAFLSAVRQSQMSRDDWLQNPGQLSGMLEEYEIDIWFSTEGTWGLGGAAGFLDGDVLSARDGVVVAPIEDLLPLDVPAGIPQRGVDFGLDGVTTDRRGNTEGIHFSTEILYDNKRSFTDGDVLLAGSGTVIHPNQGLITCFEPRADFLGLDAFHSIAVEKPTKDVYLPVVLKALRPLMR